MSLTVSSLRFMCSNSRCDRVMLWDGVPMNMMLPLFAASSRLSFSVNSTPPVSMTAEVLCRRLGRELCV